MDFLCLVFVLIDICSFQVKMSVLKGHTDYINSMAYEPEKGDLILSSSDDQTGKLWDLETGQAIHTFHLTSPGTLYSTVPSVPISIYFQNATRCAF